MIGFTLSALVKQKQFTDGDNFQVVNLNNDLQGTQENGLYPFKTSVLNKYMVHYKGPLKETL